MPAGGREKMRYIVNSREMNLYDSRTIEEFHMPQAVLMERAAFSFVETPVSYTHLTLPTN